MIELTETFKLKKYSGLMIVLYVLSLFKWIVLVIISWSLTIVSHPKSEQFPKQNINPWNYYLLSPLGFKILRQLLYVFWNSMEHECINKTSKFETDFLEKKASTIFVASQFLRGTPRYFVFWNFNGIFLYIFPDLHFSMQTHRLIEHTCYPLFEK